MFEKVQNFRDFGGYETSGDGVVRRGLLFRSAKLSGATPADETTFGTLGLKAVIDLRRRAERDRSPTGTWTEGLHLITSDTGGDTDPWSQFLLDPERVVDAEAMHRLALEFYESAPYDDRHVELFSAYFRVLAAADGPVLVHCTAGKDRTGMIVALTHHLLGVQHADIIEDYLLTNRYWDYAVFGEAVAVMLSEEIGRPLSESAIRAAMRVHIDFIETTFATIRRKSGSIDTYLRDVLGVSDDDRTALRARLVEPA